MNKDFSHIFEHDYPGFDNFCKEVLLPMFGDRIELMSRSEDFIATTGKNEQADAANILSIQKVAEINPTEDQDNFDEIYVFDITMRDNCRIAQNRVGIQQLIRSQLMLDTKAFMIFHYEHPEGGRSWRFSYFYKSATDSMDRKRYTYVFGEGQSSKTANERFNLLSDALHGTKTVYNAAIEDAFSVEKLSDEFFYKYLGFYASFVKYITGEPTSQEKGDHKITERVFRETLAKMDALAMNDSHDLFNTSFASAYPDKKARTKAVCDYVKKMMGRLVFLHFLQRKGWMCSDRKFMLHLLLNTNHKDDFLDRVLEPLFFAVLNTHSKERLLKIEKHNAIIAGNKNKVEWDVAQIEAWSSIPYLNGGLFEEDHADGCRCIFPYEYFIALFDFFSQYNFTVDENDPSDAEVGVDPEMLSKIFESLLEDNKDKGAFYTPKEIVSYMCRSALSSYLKVPLSSLGVQESAVDAFVNNPQEHHDFTEEQRTVLLNSLRTVRICDPAIGSGAFPVGMMNLLYQCRRSLEGSDARAVDIKTDIIQHNIFGVDIEQGAVDIARLRFWLALVVDEEEAHALPNLDYRIVRGNSLLTTFNNEYINLGEDKPSNRTKLAKLKKQLAIAQGEYYNLCGEEKLQKEIEIKLLLLDIIAMRLDIDIKVADEVATDNPTLFDVPRNARQTKAQKEAIALAEQKRKSRVQLKELREKLLASKKISLIERARTDINFFDWDIIFSDVFAEKKGFDVVIGNPPYFVYEASNKVHIDEFHRDANTFAMAFGGKLNAYKVFLAKGLKGLLRKNGILSFIFQNSFVADKQAIGLRKYTLSNTQILHIDSFPERDNKRKRVFESAKMSVCIVYIRNEKSQAPFTINFWADKHMKDGLKTQFSPSQIFALDEEEATIPRLEAANIPLIVKIKSITNVIDIKCYQGELNMSAHRKYFIQDSSKPEVLKGASVQRYYWTRNMSQGVIENVDDEKYIADFPKSEKALHHNYIRIAMQGMTGANDKIRLVSTLVPKGMYLAHSCNYIIPNSEVPLEYELGLLNSKLFNWFFRCFSTNSNVNSYEVENIPVVVGEKEQCQHIQDIVNRILSAKQSDPSADTTVLENEIDFMVYKLYGLTYDEVLVVDPETPFTREQYEAKKL